MILRPERLAALLEEVAQERLSLRTGSPSDAGIACEKLADLAAYYIPELVDYVQRLNPVAAPEAVVAGGLTPAQLAPLRERLAELATEIELEHWYEHDRDLATLLAAYDAQAARATQAESRVGELDAEAAEIGGYVEEIDRRVQQLEKQAYGEWVDVRERLPPCSDIHPKAGHNISALVIVAQRGVTLVEPHYMRYDKSWFAGAFATPDITHWYPMPPDPGLATESAAQPQEGGQDA